MIIRKQYKMRWLLMLGVLFSSIQIAQTQTFTAGTCELNRLIPDNNLSGVVQNVSVTIGGADVLGTDVILDQINIYVTHNWGVDLELRLISPNNDTVLLADNRLGNCSYGTACTNLSFRDDGANGSIAAAPGGFGCADVSGNYIPEETLSNFNSGTAASGTWKLFALDNNFADAGQIEGVELVFVAAPACPNPTNLSVANSNASDAMVSFNQGSVSSTYTVEYGTTGFTLGSASSVTGTTGAGLNNQVISGLSPETTYDVYVYDNCPSDTLGPITFTTGPVNDDCSGALTISCAGSVTGNTDNAHISSPAAGDCGAEQLNGPGVWYSFVGTDNRILLSTCSPNSDFDTRISVYKRSCGDLVCVGGNDDGAEFGRGGACQQSGGGTGGADFLSQIEFSAEVDTSYFVLVHGADGSTGDFTLTMTCSAPCVSPGNDICSSADSIAIDNFGACSGLSAQGSQCATPALVLPSCSDGRTVYDVWYKFNSEGSSEIELIVNRTSVDTLNLTVYSDCNGTEVECITDLTDTIEIVDLEPQTVYWLQLWNSIGEQGDFDVCVQKNTPCPAPSSLAAQNLTTTGATLRFVTSEAGGQYIVEYDTAGFTVGNGTILTGTTALGTNNLGVTGLLANTKYEYYVKMICSGSDTSSLSGPLAFTTACEAFVAPYLFDLDNPIIGETSNDLNCFSFAISSSGESWNIDQASENGPLADFTSGSGYFLYADDSESPGTPDLSFETAEVDVSGLTTPEIQFFFFADNTSSTVTLTVDVFDGASYNNALFTYNSGNTNGAWAEGRVDLSGLTITGNVIARFNVNEANGTDGNDVAIDNINFREAPFCGNPDSELPTITCPADISQCPANVTFVNPTGLDNCIGATTTQTAGLASGSNFPEGATVQEFTVTDGDGNMANCTFTVTVQATIAAVEPKVSAAVGNFSEPLDQKDFFGTDLAYIGDVNGDGFEDIAVSARGDDDSPILGKKGNRHGAVYILFLNSDNSVRSYQKISAEHGNFRGPLDKVDKFGTAIDGIGDIDGDGVPDIAVGAMFDDDGPGGTKGKDHGCVYIIRLNTDGTVKGSNKISADSGAVPIVLDKKELFGVSIAGMGDLDGDGVPDIAVGARNSTAFSPSLGKDKKNVGAVYVIKLNSNGHVKSYNRITTDTPSLDILLGGKDRFGESVANLGDLDDDGVNDLVIGASGDDDGPSGTKGSDFGAIYIVTLNSDGTPKGTHKISAGIGGLTGPLGKKEQFGASVASLGDMNGDGHPDVAVGAPFDDEPAPGDKPKDQGSAFVLYLNPNGTVKNEFKVSAASPGFTGDVNQKDLLGFSLASQVGDCNTILTAGAIMDDDGPPGGKAKDNGAYWNLLIPEFFGSSDPLPTTAASKQSEDAQLLNFSASSGEELNIQMHVYPNPNSGAFSLQLLGDVNEIEFISVFDAFGKLVEQRKSQGDQLYLFDLADLAEGMYFLQLSTASHRLTHKVILSR